MKAINACLPCEILISKHLPHGKKKIKNSESGLFNLDFTRRAELVLSKLLQNGPSNESYVTITNIMAKLQDLATVL